MVDQNDVDLFRRLRDVEDRIGDPIDCGHRLAVEFDFFPQGAAHALHDVALNRLGHTVRVDDLATVMADRELARPDLATGAVDVDLGNDGDPGAVALRIGDAAAGHFAGGLVLAWRRPRLPASLPRPRLVPAHLTPPLPT